MQSMYIQGINLQERVRRKESNALSTKINFLAWLIEVSGENKFCGLFMVENLIIQNIAVNRLHVFLVLVNSIEQEL